MADLDYSDLAYNLAGVRRSNPFDRRRQLAYGFMQQGLDASPVQHPFQGASRMAQAMLGAWMANKVDTDEQAAIQKQQGALAAAMAEPDPQKRIALLSASNPELGARLSGQLAVEQAKIDRQTAGLQTGAQQLAAGYGMPSGGSGDAGARIAGIESSGRYGAVGPVANAQGHRAYGKFQVLEPNIGPWTQEVLGKAMTPQEFLQNPQAQEAVFKAKFGQYAQQYGSQEAAARAWFAGPSGMNNPNARDVNGTTVAGYSQKFTGQPMPQVAQGNNPQAAPGMPPQPTPQGINAPAVVAPPAVPDVPRPTQPSQQILSQADALLRSGQFGRDPATAGPAARAWVDQQMEREYQAAKERAGKQYEQSYDTFKNDRTQAQNAPQKLFDNASKLRDDYRGEPVVKSYRVVVPMLESAKDAATRPTRAADINLVYAFAKLMDPDSVVRESETGMVTATGTVKDRIEGLLGQLNGGPMLQPETRQRLLAELDSRFKSLEQSYNQITDAYGQIADSGGIPRGHVILPIRPDKPKGEAAPAGPRQLGANGEGYDQIKPGEQYVAPDGSLRTKGGK